MISGYFSSFVTLFVTLFGLPRIAAFLPKPEMAIYVAVSAIASISYWAQIGAGPALTQRISRANAVGDTNEIRLQVQSAVGLVSVMTILCGCLGLAFLASGAFSSFYGFENTLVSSQKLSFLFVLGFACYNLMISPILRAQSGLHQTYFKNWLNSAGNVVILGLLLFVLPSHHTSVWALCFMFGPIAAIDVMNATLFLKQFKFIWKARVHLPDAAIRAAVLDSVAYTIFELSFVLVRELTKGYVGRSEGSDTLAKFGLLLQASIILQALSNTIVLPLLPVFTDLIASHQTSRFKSLFVKYGAIFTGLAVLGAALLLCLPFNPLGILFRNYTFSPLDNFAVLVLGFSNVFRFYCGFALYGMAKVWAPTFFSCLGALSAGLAAYLFRAGSVGEITLAFGVAGCVIYGGLQFPYVLASIGRAKLGPAAT